MTIMHLDRPEIEAILANRCRLFMLDRAEIDNDAGTAKGFFRITEEVYRGRLPSSPIFLDTDGIQVLLQTLAVAVAKKLPRGKIAIATSVDGVSFNRSAKVGDEIRSEVRVTRIESGIVIGYGSVHVEDRQICKASDLILEIVPKSKPK